MHAATATQAQLAYVTRAQKLLHRQAFAALRTLIGLVIGALIIASLM